MHVVYEHRDERWVQAELAKIHPNLFLDKEWGRDGELLYSIAFARGDQPPETIFWWTSEWNRPLPLSSGIIEKLRSLEGEDSVFARAKRANDDKRAELEQDAEREYEEIGREGDKLTHPGHSALLPRGQHLRRSRDRQRSRGEKV